MTQADVEGVGRDVKVVGTGLGFFKLNLILRPACHSVNIRALTERVIVTNANNVTLQINLIHFGMICEAGHAIGSFCVNITETEHSLAASNGSVCSQGNTVAFDLEVANFSKVGHRPRNGSSLEFARDPANRGEFNLVEVLTTEVNLNNFEVVATAKGNGQAVVNVVTVNSVAEGSVVDRVNGEVAGDRTIVVGCADGIVTIARGFVTMPSEPMPYCA